jgi:short-subunit dehydrogenase
LPSCTTSFPAWSTGPNSPARRAGLINVASSLAFFPVPTFATYAASKALILSFTESFAAEMTDKPIDVLAAAPAP